MIHMYLFWILALASVCGVCGQDAKKTDTVEDKLEAPKEPELAKELAKRYATDQAARKELIEFSTKHNLFAKPITADTDPKIAAAHKALIEKLTAEDLRNRLWLKEIVEKHGWPGQSLVGKVGAQTAWLLAQHADSDREFQKKCLAKMEAMPKGEVEPKHIAYLTDRILVGEGKKQKYGTQAKFQDGKVLPAPIEDEAKVDQRRKSLGLEPLADYLKLMEKMYAPPKKPGD
jgi:hypothetical protein